MDIEYQPQFSDPAIQEEISTIQEDCSKIASNRIVPFLVPPEGMTSIPAYRNFMGRANGYIRTLFREKYKAKCTADDILRYFEGVEH
jgi:hypothetical protein